MFSIATVSDCLLFLNAIFCFYARGSCRRITRGFQSERIFSRIVLTGWKVLAEYFSLANVRDAIGKLADLMGLARPTLSFINEAAWLRSYWNVLIRPLMTTLTWNVSRHTSCLARYKPSTMISLILPCISIPGSRRRISLSCNRGFRVIMSSS